jgi:AcrR family transcriptional regulator
MPKEKTRRPGVAGRSETAILDAAKALFLEEGYDAVSLDQIAERAGVSRQTVYNRFGGKEPLFRAMIERHWGVFEGPAAFPYPAPAGAPPAQPEGVLRQVARALIYFIDKTDQIAFTRLVIAESRRLPWIGEAFYRLGKAAPLAAFAEGLRAMDADGLIDCPHPELAARQFIGLIQEFVIWPHVMAIGPAAQSLPPTPLVVDEAVAMFLARYGRRTSS